MSAVSSDPLPDATLFTDRPQPPPPPKPSTSPPFADAVVRPFTSQGSSSRTPLQLLAHARVGDRADHRPSSVDGSPADSPSDRFGPYMSASARTSYTRVDVDSSPSPVYPPLPPLPTAFTARGVPIFATATDSPTTFPDSTTPMTPSPVPPAIDTQPSVTEPPIPHTPQVSLTFLLVTGLRKTQSFEPETTVGRVKELVWNAWPARDADWQDERPPAPSYLRILYLGKILQDDDTLLHVGFPTSLPSVLNAAPTIVHLSIRPCAPPSEDFVLNKKKRLSVAIGRRLSTAGVAFGVGMVGGGRDSVQEAEDDVRRSGCCTGCTIC